MRLIAAIDRVQTGEHNRQSAYLKWIRIAVAYSNTLHWVYSRRSFEKEDMSLKASFSGEISFPTAKIDISNVTFEFTLYYSQTR